MGKMRLDLESFPARLGIKPTTWLGALAGNQTSDLSGALDDTQPTEPQCPGPL